jgi:hypothetical protein
MDASRVPLALGLDKLSMADRRGESTNVIASKPLQLSQEK